MHLYGDAGRPLGAGRRGHQHALDRHPHRLRVDGLGPAIVGHTCNNWPEWSEPIVVHRGREYWSGAIRDADSRGEGRLWSNQTGTPPPPTPGNLRFMPANSQRD